MVSQGVAKFNASGCDYVQEEGLFLQENVPAVLYGMWNYAIPHTDQNEIFVCIFGNWDLWDPVCHMSAQNLVMHWDGANRKVLGEVGTGNKTAANTRSKSGPETLPQMQRVKDKIVFGRHLL